MWWLFGYSFVFADGDGAGAWIGDFKKFALLNGVDSSTNPAYATWVSHNVFSMYQMMFAIITPALIIGAIAERMKFSAILLFVALWMAIVYFPLAHWVWGATGAMNGVWNAGASIKAIDFAGGTVVHMSSGWSALVLCIILGKRLGFGKQPMPPHSMVLCMIGTGMLWVGWYGFNAGSAGAADGVAANAFMTTTMATAVASFVWPMVEWLIKGKPSVLGFCSGAVAGLVVITPACGFVTVGGSILIGICVKASAPVAEREIKYPSKDPMWSGLQGALASLQAGDVRGPMKTPGGWMFFEVISKQQSTQKLEQLPPQIQNALTQEAIEARRDKRLSAFTDSLRAATKIEIYRDRLKTIPWPVPAANAAS